MSVKAELGWPMMLGAATAAKVRLIVWCKSCGHQVEPDPAEMAARYGAGASVLDWRTSSRAPASESPSARAEGPRSSAARCRQHCRSGRCDRLPPVPPPLLFAAVGLAMGATVRSGTRCEFSELSHIESLWDFSLNSQASSGRGRSGSTFLALANIAIATVVRRPLRRCSAAGSLRRN
jgi:hypothetical protein